MLRINRLPAPLRRFLADRFVPHGYAGYERFDRLYAVGGDPWAARDSRNARLRFATLIEMVEARAPDSILDVGCGEGVFTERLASIAREEVIGIDPSPIAIERASRRVPGATFLCTTLEAFDPRRKVDVVTAVEMLYYVESVEATLEKLRKLGRTVLAYTNRDRARLDPHLDPYGNACRRSVVRFGRVRRGGFTIAVLEEESG